MMAYAMNAGLATPIDFDNSRLHYPSITLPSISDVYRDLLDLKIALDNHCIGIVFAHRCGRAFDAVAVCITDNSAFKPYQVFIMKRIIQPPIIIH